MCLFDTIPPPLCINYTINRKCVSKSLNVSNFSNIHHQQQQQQEESLIETSRLVENVGWSCFNAMQWVWEREANINWSTVTCKMAALVRNYLEVYLPRVGGLSVVNAIGSTQLRDPTNSGLTR